MKNSIIVLLCLIIGILFGHFMPENIVNLCTDLPHWLLYLLILQVGLNLGANSDLSSIIHSIRVSDFSFLFSLLPAHCFSLQWPASCLTHGQYATAWLWVVDLPIILFHRYLSYNSKKQVSVSIWHHN